MKQGKVHPRQSWNLNFRLSHAGTCAGGDRREHIQNKSPGPGKPEKAPGAAERDLVSL